MKEKLVPVLPAFARLIAGWILLMFLMRVSEWLLNGFQHQFPQEGFRFWQAALQADLIFISRMGLVLLLLFAGLSMFSLRVARISTWVLLLVISWGYFALQQYYLQTGVLLGADLYGYSARDIRQTTGASGGINMLTILALLAIGLLLFTGLRYFSQRAISQRQAIAGIGLVLLPGLILSMSGAPFSPPRNAYAQQLAVHKLDHFIRASWEYAFPAPHEMDIYSDAYSGDFEDEGSPISSFTYPREKEFPFLHADSTSDVLSPFFSSSAEKPHIVLIVVEGLGRAFTNEDAYLGNFTPFLDSLAQHSLYWENFLSGSGRTFAVLPTLLGSLPFGKNGFCEWKPAMPTHQSLPKILAQNGFASSFYYGGDASFDNMDAFLREEQVAGIYDKKKFPAEYRSLPANNGFSWGYGDAELYRYYLQNTPVTGGPRLDVLLTVSTHSPFLINDQEMYLQKIDQRISELSLSSDQQRVARAYRQQLSTVLYADEALRQFFAAYAQRPDFANSIFLITGDHRMPEIPMSSKIDRYHVPMILYSPLLNRTARFQSISSHFDITPSLLAFLQQRYALQTPSLVTWLGSGLDTARGLRNIHAQTLMQTKTDIVDYVRGLYHLNNGELFRISNHLQEEAVNDPSMQQALRSGLDQFLEKNQHAIESGKLQPD